MISNAEIKKTVMKALISEYQAVGIYQAEVFWNKYPQKTFEAILKDENRHLINMKMFLKNNAWTCSLWNGMKMNLNQAMGWLIGTCFSLLPRKLCFRFHSTAERKAANSYKNFLHILDKTKLDDFKQKEKFKSSLKTMMNNELIHSEIFTFHSLLYEK